MVRDRLSEMKNMSDQKSVKKRGQEKGIFLETIEQISTQIETAESNAQDIKRVQKKIFNEPSERERKKYEAEHSDLVEQNKRICRSLQKSIKEEQKKIETGNGKKNQDRRVQQNQLQSVSIRYLNVWSKFNDGQIEFREKTKKRLLLSNKITNRDMTEEQVEQVLDDGGGGFYAGSIVQDTAKAKEDLNHLESRQESFLKLEKSIEEVAEMFMELQTIVSMQKEMVDRIEGNIGDAEVHVEKGKKEMFKAWKKQMAARKKKCVLVSVIVGGVLIVVLVVVVACIL